MVLSAVLEMEQRGQFEEALDTLDNAKVDIEENMVKCRILHFLDHIIEANDVLNTLFQDFDTIDENLLKLGLHTINIEFLIPKGEMEEIGFHLKQAQNFVKIIEKQDKYKENIWYIRYLYTHGKLLQKENKYKKSLTLFEDCLKLFSVINNKREIANVLNSIGSLHEDEWKLSKAIDFCQRSLRIREELDNKYDIANSLNQLGIIHAKQNKMDPALEYFNKAKNFYKSIHNLGELQKIHANIGNLHRIKGDLKLAEKSCLDALEIATQMGNKITMTQSLRTLGAIQLFAGDLKKAKKTCLQGEILAHETDSKQELATILNNLGVIHKKLGGEGDISAAINYYEKSLELEKELGAHDLKTIAILHNNIGSLYLLKGDEIQKALDNLLSALDINRNLDKDLSSIEQVGNLNVIGKVYLMQGNVEKAIEYLETAYKNVKSQDNDLLKSEILYSLFYCYSSIYRSETRGRISEADKNLMISYYEKLNEVAKKSKIKTIKARERLAYGLLKMKQGVRMTQVVEANEIFREVEEGDLIDIEFKILAMLNRCEYAVFELRSQDEDQKGTRGEILYEVKTILGRLYEMATNQESYSLLIEILLIQSKLAMADKNLQDSSNYLNDAMDIAERLELGSYKIKISNIIHRNEMDMIKYTKQFNNPEILADMEMRMAESYLEDVALLVNQASIKQHLYKEKNGDARINASRNLVRVLQEDENLPDDIKKYLPFFGLSIEELSVLRKTHSLVNKFEDNKFLLKSSKLKLDGIINDSLDLILARITNMGIDIEFDVDYNNQTNYKGLKSEGDLVIYSDREIITLVIENLLINAAKFNYQNGYIHIKLTDLEDHWNLSIQNHSKVIPKDKLEYIFEKFALHEHDEHTKKTGAGMGLYFVKQALNLIGGSVSLYSPIVGKKLGVHVIVQLPKQMKKN